MANCFNKCYEIVLNKKNKKIISDLLGMNPLPGICPIYMIIMFLCR